MPYQLFPKTVAAKIPALYSQENEDDPKVVAHFFALGSSWSWYVIEGRPADTTGKPNDWLFFGYVVGQESELGYFLLSELRELRYSPIKGLPASIPRVERESALSAVQTLRDQGKESEEVRMKFSDGMEIDTSGDYRIIKESDGYYVTGKGTLCAVETLEEGRRMILDMTGMANCSAPDCDKSSTRLWFGRPRCEEHYITEMNDEREKLQRERGIGKWRSDNDEATS